MSSQQGADEDSTYCAPGAVPLRSPTGGDQRGTLKEQLAVFVPTFVPSAFPLNPHL